MSHERKFSFLIAIIRLKTLYWWEWRVLRSMETHKSYQQTILKLFKIVLTEITSQLPLIFLWESSFLLPQMLLGAELCEFGTVLSGVSTFPILFSQILECALWFSRWSRKIFEGIMGFYNFIYLFLQYYGCNTDDNTGGKCLDRHQLLDKTWNKIYFST